MLDEMQRLSESESMHRLLDHYATKGIDDRMFWKDRLMELESVTAGELTRLHGELLAAEWVEMNVGVTSGKCPGGVASCYRVTVAGLRAWKRTQGGFYLEDEQEEPSPPKQHRPTARGGKRGKKVTTQAKQEPALAEAVQAETQSSPSADAAGQVSATDTPMVTP
jgi:hypothetical protein